MTITLWNNKSDANVVHKDLELVGQLNIDLQLDKPLLDMDITIPKSEITFNENMINYITVTDFKRDYFVKEIVKSRAGVITLNLHEDVLSTHFDKIKNLNAIIGRQEKAYNLYVPDGNIPMQTKKNVVTKRFAKSLSDTTGAMILITQGGEYFIKENEPTEGGTQ